jgi:hypothetical protein
MDEMTEAHANDAPLNLSEEAALDLPTPLSARQEFTTAASVSTFEKAEPAESLEEGEEVEVENQEESMSVVMESVVEDQLVEHDQSATPDAHLLEDNRTRLNIISKRIHDLKQRSLLAEERKKQQQDRLEGVYDGVMVCLLFVIFCACGGGCLGVSVLV